MTESRLRHPLIVRVCHWLLAASGLLLCFTGIGTMPLYARFFINEIPGLSWSSDMLLQLRLHYLLAGIFSAVGVFHLVYHLRRRQLALLPRRGDILESWLTLKALLLKKPEPQHDKFIAEQRLVYAFYLCISLIILATGWLLIYRQFSSQILPPDLLQFFILLHLGAGLLFAAGFVLHLLAFLPKENRALFKSMFSGRVSAAYARHRHPKWKAD